MRLTFWRRPRAEREKALRAEVRDLARRLGEANATVNQHEATIGALNSAIQGYARNLATEQLLVQQVARERDEVRQQVAEMAADNQIKADEIRRLEAPLFDAREVVRQERRARARAERDAAVVTADGLGAAMARLEWPSGPS